MNVFCKSGKLYRKVFRILWVEVEARVGIYYKPSVLYGNRALRKLRVRDITFWYVLV